MNTQAESHQRKADVQAALHLDSEPTDEFMALLAALGDGDVVAAPTAARPTRTYRPGEIEQILLT